jgi:hypothetical protein
LLTGKNAGLAWGKSGNFAGSVECAAAGVEQGIWSVAVVSADVLLVYNVITCMLFGLEARRLSQQQQDE